MPTHNILFLEMKNNLPLFPYNILHVIMHTHNKLILIFFCKIKREEVKGVKSKICFYIFTLNTTRSIR